MLVVDTVAAYAVSLPDGHLYVTPTTSLRSLCLPVDEAVRRLHLGEVVLVAGADMVAVRRRLFELAESEAVTHQAEDWVLL